MAHVTSLTDSRLARAQAAARAADRLVAADLAQLPVMVGFDGFVDLIIDVVAQRTAPGPEGYRRIATISEYAQRCAGAAGKSTNLEIVVKEQRFGGNGPLMGGAIAQLGAPLTYVGSIGGGGSGGGGGGGDAIDPAFNDFARRCRAAGGVVIPVGPPAQTHALEFDDGKLMFNDPRNVQSVSWESLSSFPGPDALGAMIRTARLLAIVNWTNMPSVTGIVRGVTDLLAQSGWTRPRVFIDLSDPARRTEADLRELLDLLRALNTHTPVTLGLNLAEAEQVDRVSGGGAFDGPGRGGAAIEKAAAALLRRLGLDTVVIHPREGAGAADAQGRSVWFEGPLCARPKLSTGAGDHFNAGFAVAQALGAPLDEACALGCAVSGAYVRDGASPTRTRLAQFLRELPDPEQ